MPRYPLATRADAGKQKDRPVRNAAFAALQGCALFAGVTNGSLRQLAASSSVRRVPAARALSIAGAPFPYLGLVIEGSINARTHADNVRDELLYESSAGETFAEIPLLDEQDTLWDFEAPRGGALVVLVPRAAIIRACRRSPSLALRLAQAAARRARTVAQRLAALAFGSTTMRVARVVRGEAPASSDWIDAPAEISRLSQSDIAERAGTVRVVAARALHALETAGAIEMHRGRVLKIHPARLDKYESSLERR